MKEKFSWLNRHKMIALYLLVLVVWVVYALGCAGWDALGWFILVHFGTLPLAAAVALGTLAGLLLRRKRKKTEGKT